jgi:hypothetical protein
LRRAERKAGQPLRQMEKAKAAPGNQYTGPVERPDRSTTLRELGITKDQSSQWQRLAASRGRNSSWRSPAPGSRRPAALSRRPFRQNSGQYWTVRFGFGRAYAISMISDLGKHEAMSAMAATPRRLAAAPELLSG